MKLSMSPFGRKITSRMAGGRKPPPAYPGYSGRSRRPAARNPFLARLVVRWKRLSAGSRSFFESFSAQKKRRYARRKLFFARLSARRERLSAKARYFLSGLFFGRKSLLDLDDDLPQPTPEPGPAGRKPLLAGLFAACGGRLASWKKPLAAAAGKARPVLEKRPSPEPVPTGLLAGLLAACRERLAFRKKPIPAAGKVPQTLEKRPSLEPAATGKVRLVMERRPSLEPAPIRKRSFLARLFAARRERLAHKKRQIPEARKAPPALEKRPSLEPVPAKKKWFLARLFAARRERVSARKKSLLVTASRVRQSTGKKSFLERLSVGGKRFFARPAVRRSRLPDEKPDLPAGEKPLLRRSLAGRRIDALLFVATLMVLVLVTSSYFRRVLFEAPAAVSIFVSPHYWAMFGDAADTFVREFEEQNPGFRIVAAEHENQDILFFDDGEFAALIEASALASLSPYVYTETEEDQWALPLVAFVDLFFYNIDILQRAGNDRPPGTRAEFMAAARSVAEAAAENREDIYPFALGLGDDDPLGIRRDFHPWVWAQGGEVHSGFADDGTLTLTVPATNTINFFADMKSEGLIAPGSFEKTGRQRLEQFAEGRIAMMVASARDILFVRESPHGINFDITAIPAAAPGRNRLGLSGIYAGISADSTQPDKAWAFLVFVAGRSHLLAAALGAVPGSFFINFPSGHIEDDPLFSKAWEIFEAADIVEFQSDDILEKRAGRIILERLARAFEAE